MKLQTKLIVTVLLTVLISLFLIERITFSNAERTLEVRVIQDLDSTAQALESFIEQVLEEQKSQLEIIATYEELTLEELIEIQDLQEEVYELFVLDSNGKVSMTSNPDEEIGTDFSTAFFFLNGKIDSYIQKMSYDEEFERLGIVISTPFKEGVLVARIGFNLFEEIVSDKTGLGDTGESLLGYRDKNGEIVFLTERRFEEEEEEETNEKHHVLPIEEALNKNEDVFLGLHDYKHIDVIAATRYIEGAELGLVVKIDEAEAFADVQTLRTIFIFVNLITLILIGFVIYIVAKSISKDVGDLTQKVDEITKGNLGIQLEKSNIFEIQSLTESLNRILSSMKLAMLRTGLKKEEIGLGEALEAKEEAEEKYKSLYDSSRDAIMTIESPTWKFTAGNPATIKLFGAKDEAEFITKGPWDVSPKKQPDGQLSSEKSKKMIMKAMKEGSSFFEWTHKKLTGEEFPATVLLTRFKLKGKDVVQATVRDISEEKEAKLKYMGLFENATDIIQSVDKEGKFVYVNLAWKNTLGYSDEEIKKLSFKDIIAKEHLNRCNKIFKEIMKGKTLENIETIFVTKKGEMISVEGNINANFKDNKFISTTGIFRDTTKRKKTEEILKKRSLELERIAKLSVGKEEKILRLQKKIKDLERKFKGARITKKKENGRKIKRK